MNGKMQPTNPAGAKPSSAFYPTANVDPSTGSAMSPGQAAGTSYTDVSIASLSAGQAAGTSTIRAANSARKIIMINPPADCFLAIASSATAGWPLFAGVPNTITGQECPTNALYINGLSAGAVLTIWEG